MPAAATCVVFGGGALGSAVARLAHANGENVVVASRNHGQHPGWWRAVDLAGEPKLAWIPRDAHLVLAVGPNDAEGAQAAEAVIRAVPRLLRSFPRSVVVALPAGLVGETSAYERLGKLAQDSGAAILRTGPLFGQGDHHLSRYMLALRGGETVRAPDLPPVRVLCADDAAKVAILLRGTAAEVEISGDERWSLWSGIDLLQRRFGGERRSPLWGKRPPAALRQRIDAWRTLGNHWDEIRFGPRTSLVEWVERLPGPRRRVTASRPGLSEATDS